MLVLWLLLGDGKDEMGGSAYGISLFDDEAILQNLNLICGKMRQLLDVIAALRQFKQLCKLT